MKASGKLMQMVRVPRLTRGRMAFALGVAMIADGLQLLMGSFGWVGADQIIDVIAMILTWWALGFHILLLPTFIVELFPLVDMLPTWTGCVAAVIMLRKREQRPPEEPPTISA